MACHPGFDSHSQVMFATETIEYLHRVVLTRRKRWFAIGSPMASRRP